MDKYDTSYNDPYCYSETTVLRNKLNIRDFDELENAEREITAFTISLVTYEDQNIVKFIQNKSIEEIKTLFLNFLTKEIQVDTPQQNHKWAEFAQKMNGRISQKTAKVLETSSREFREGFSFRDLSSY